jgi:hypothetical protein
MLAKNNLINLLQWWQLLSSAEAAKNNHMEQL